MENNLELDNKALNKPKKSRSASTVTNPVAKNKPPADKVKNKKTAPIPAPGRDSSPAETQLDKNREIVARINSINTVKSLSQIILHCLCRI